MENQKPDPGSMIKWISDMCNVISSHGVTKVIVSIFTLAFAVIMLTVIFNPELIFNRIEEYIEQKEADNRAFRENSDPLIRSQIKDLLYKADGNRVCVLEFHNGTANPSSLGFYYAEMTYEDQTNDLIGISHQYKSVNLSLLNISTILKENGYWYGSIEELKEIDRSIAIHMEGNGCKWIALYLLEGSRELGILTISFNRLPENAEIPKIGREIRKHGSTITSLIDYKEHIK